MKHQMMRVNIVQKLLIVLIYCSIKKLKSSIEAKEREGDFVETLWLPVVTAGDSTSSLVEELEMTIVKSREYY